MDRRSISDTSEVWKNAAISGNEFISLTENAHELLRAMMLETFDRDMKLPDYCGADIEKILSAYSERYPEKLSFKGKIQNMGGHR